MLDAHGTPGLSLVSVPPILLFSYISVVVASILPWK